MRLVILGAGKYGREIEDVAVQTGRYDEIVFLDDFASGPNVLGKCGDFAGAMNESTEFFVAFGDNEMRARWLRALIDAKAHVVNIVHPTAYINSYCVIEDGCMINSGAIVDHDTTIGAYAHICVGAIVKADNIIPGKKKIEAGVVIERGTYK